MRKNIVKAIAVAARATVTMGKLGAVASLVLPPVTSVAYARYDLPKPYVSRALDAVLVPINHASRQRYHIPPSMHGVYVLAVDPHGVAARQGIRAGDVLSTVRSHPILVPADVDRLVWTALAVSVTDFLFGVSRGGSVVAVDTNITVNNFNQTINVNNISNWTSIDNHQDWTQIVNQYDTDLSDSLSDDIYRDDDDDSASSDDTDDDDANDDDTDGDDDSDDGTDGDDTDNDDDSDDDDDSDGDDGTDDDDDSDDNDTDGDADDDDDSDNADDEN